MLVDNIWASSITGTTPNLKTNIPAKSGMFGAACLKNKKDLSLWASISGMEIRMLAA